MKNRFGLYTPFIIIGGLSAIWSGVWYYAASKTEAVIADTLAKEATHGREWTCPNRRVSGFPFRIEVTCDAPTFVSKQTDKAGSGNLGGLSVQARIVDPTRAIATLKSPLKFEAQGGAINIAWADAKTSLSGSTNSFSDFSLDMSQVTIAIKTPQGENIIAGAKRININLAQDPLDTPLSAPFKLLTKLEGVTFAPIDALAGNAQPLNLETQLRATHVPLKPNPDWRIMLDAWRNAGGKFSIALLDINKGVIHLDAKGDLALDEERKLTGKLSANFKGLNTLLENMNLKSLSSFASNNGMTLNFRNGKILLGPIPVGSLQAVY
jgi:hypothetical protein